MGIAFKIIRFVASGIPKSWHAKLNGFYSRHACVSILRIKGLWATLSEIFFHKYTGKKAHQQRLKKLEEIRKKDIITVVFQVWNIAKWKCDSVYRAMEQHPRFRPIVWITDIPISPDQEKLAARKKMEAFFSRPEYNYCYAENREALYKLVKPDITFIQEPYELNSDAIKSVLEGELLCFVSYYISNTISKIGHNTFLLFTTIMRYVENQSSRKELTCILQNKGRNLVAVGHPILDILRTEKSEARKVWKTNHTGVKKLIWAPHWTITNESFYSNSSFLTICDDMIRIARKYVDTLHIAFKPHPSLYRILCGHPDWGKEKTDEYYKLWETMPNTQVEEGEYIDLFWQSDAMIHDCGSFIIEYPMVNKPCLYIQRGQGYNEFNSFAKNALNCYTIGQNVIDIENFIIEQVIGQDDKKREIREQFIQDYLSPYGGKSAAENILESILS